jgi:hypothetical protein
MQLPTYVLVYLVSLGCVTSRRERGQRELEQRLAEKLVAVRSTESTSSDASDKV